MTSFTRGAAAFVQVDGVGEVFLAQAAGGTVAVGGVLGVAVCVGGVALKGGAGLDGDLVV